MRRLPLLPLLRTAHYATSGPAPSRPTSVLSFGDNSQGALGLSCPPYEAFEPTTVPSLPQDITSISAGHYHSLAVTSSGEVYAWGRNDEGQLGRGLSSSRQSWSEPRRVEGLGGVTVRSAFASGVVSAAVGDDGSLWVWGRSKRGQLGLGRGLIQATRPTRVEALAGKAIAKVSFGWGHALALTRDGALFGWGFSAEGRLGQMGHEPETPTLVATTPVDSRVRRDFSSVMETIEEEVSAELEKERNMPIIWEPRVLREVESVEVSDIACGLDHCLVLCCNGRLLSSGDNVYGQLGRAGDGSRLLPVAMDFRPLSVSAGLGHSLALCRIPSDGTPEVVSGLVSWGWNWGSQLGRGGEEGFPAVVGSLDSEDVVSASGGRTHSIALTSMSEVWTWGSGRNGRLGLGSSMDEADPSVLECLDGVEILQAISGFDHSLLLVADRGQ